MNEAGNCMWSKSYSSLEWSVTRGSSECYVLRTTITPKAALQDIESDAETGENSQWLYHTRPVTEYQRLISRPDTSLWGISHTISSSWLLEVMSPCIRDHFPRGVFKHLRRSDPAPETSRNQYRRTASRRTAYQDNRRVETCDRSYKWHLLDTWKNITDRRTEERVLHTSRRKSRAWECASQKTADFYSTLSIQAIQGTVENTQIPEYISTDPSTHLWTIRTISNHITTILSHPPPRSCF